MLLAALKKIRLNAKLEDGNDLHLEGKSLLAMVARGTLGAKGSFAELIAEHPELEHENFSDVLVKLQLIGLLTHDARVGWRLTPAGSLAYAAATADEA